VAQPSTAAAPSSKPLTAAPTTLSSLAASPQPVTAPTATVAAGPGAGATTAAKPSSPGPSSPAAALPIVERSRAGGAAGFLTPVEVELELADPLTSSDELQNLLDGVLELNGIASVRGDGIHVTVRYDSQLVLPARIRDRLRELGHPAKTGTEVQNPGDAAD
jgi:hypothetical protein